MAYIREQLSNAVSIFYLVTLTYIVSGEAITKSLFKGIQKYYICKIKIPFFFFQNYNKVKFLCVWIYVFRQKDPELIMTIHFLIYLVAKWNQLTLHDAFRFMDLTLQIVVYGTLTQRKSNFVQSRMCYEKSVVLGRPNLFTDFAYELMWYILVRVTQDLDL